MSRTLHAKCPKSSLHSAFTNWLCSVLSENESTKTMEQYLETIYDLQKKDGFATVTDIAEARNVKAPSVTYVLQKLGDAGLVNYEKYRSVTLTAEGMKVAKRLEHIHETLRWFLKLIGVDEEIADEDACEIEHIVRPETAKKLTQFAEWVQGAPKSPKWLTHFREYQETGARSPECEDDEQKLAS